MSSPMDNKRKKAEKAKKAKKREKAAVLRYKQEKDNAPRLVAKGKGCVARQIIDTARSHGIPVREDPLLVEALIGLDLYQDIPEEVYQVVAEVYLFLYRLKNMATSSG